MGKAPSEYFIGSYTPCGYKSAFEDIISGDEFYTYILTDSAESEKTNFLNSLCENDKAAEIFFCTFDTGSVDAVVFSDEKTAFADGIFPHIFSPKYSGFTAEVLPNRNKFIYEKVLHSKKEGVFLWKEYEKNLLRCEQYLKAISHIIDDIKTVANSSINIKKLDSFIARLCKKEFPLVISSETVGAVKKRQISALTSDGYKTIFPKAEKIYLINDNFFVGTNYILRKLTTFLSDKGYDIIISVSPLCSEEFYEHIFIPKLNTAFLSSNSLNKISLQEKNVINFARFYDKTLLTSKKTRLKFAFKTANLILAEAVSSLKLAKVFNTKICNLLKDNLEK